MSNQSYANPEDPYWLSSRGVDKVIFNEANPPLLPIGKHGLYVLSDDLLYYDGFPVSVGAPGGDVVGPASSTDDAIVRYNGTTGKLVQNTSIRIDDFNYMQDVEGIYSTTTLLNGNIGYLTMRSMQGTAGVDALSVVTGPWATPPNIPWSAERVGNMVTLVLGPALALNDGSADIIAINFGNAFDGFFNFIPVGADQHNVMLVRDADVDKMVSVYIAGSPGFTIQISSTFNVPPANGLTTFAAGSTGQTGFANTVTLHWICPASP